MPTRSLRPKRCSPSLTRPSVRSDIGRGGCLGGCAPAPNTHPQTVQGDDGMLVERRQVARPMRSSLRRRATLAGYLFISPVILGYLIWVAGPMIMAIWLSLTEWDMLQPAQFVGLSNYQQMLHDNLFWKSLAVTFYFTL